MTILSRNNEQGRSMVEMLGVLAIIGVLSVGGISGYSKAMAKFKLTKAQDQITMLLMNIRTAFATSPNYGGLTNANAKAYNIAPGDMISGDNLQHAFGGGVTVNSCNSKGENNGSGQYFYIQLDNLGNEACISLATSDWGSDGLVGIAGGKQTALGTALTTSTIGTPAASLPLALSSVGTYCEKGKYSTWKWVYY